MRPARVGRVPLGRPTPEPRLRAAREIDRTCEAFEQAWRAGDEPDVAAWLARFDGDGQGRSELLFELLALDLELRGGRGERPSMGRFLDRFPDQSAVVARAFATTTPRRFGDYE